MGTTLREHTLQSNEICEDAAVEISSPSLRRLSTEVALEMGRRQAWYDVRTSIPLVLTDAVGVMLSLLVASAIASLSGGTLPMNLSIGAMLLVLWLQHLHGLYPACGLSYASEFQGVLRTWMVGSVGVAFAVLLRHDAPAVGWIPWAGFSFTLFLSLAAFRPVVRRVLARSDWWTQPVVVVGNGSASKQLFGRLNRSRHEGLRPAGIVFDPDRYWDRRDWPEGSSVADSEVSSREDARNLAGGPAETAGESGAGLNRMTLPVSNSRWLGPLSDLEAIMCRVGACRLALADRGGDHWYDFHSFHGVPHLMLPIETSDHPTDTVRLVESDGGIELHCYSALTKPHALVAKRTMDLMIVIGAMPLWIPVMVTIALAIKYFDPGPVFYFQDRVGRFRMPFRAMKFRSMVCDAEQRLKEHLDSHPEARSEWQRTHKLKQDPRVTAVGRFLRKTSLDELPQVINVLNGDMSLVGPRPIIDRGEYDREYIQDHPEVFELYQMVRPGITGLWQVSGRNATAYVRRVQLDRIYLHNWSISLDLFILWRTIKTALLREGAC